MIEHPSVGESGFSVTSETIMMTGFAMIGFIFDLF
jgi:hypothetical protein